MQLSLEKKRTYRQTRKEKCKKAGLCFNCNQKSAPFSLCEKHRKQRNAYSVKSRAKNHAPKPTKTFTCQICEVIFPAKQKRSTCSSTCAVLLHRKRASLNKKSRKERGLCTDCSHSAAKNKTLCVPCIRKRSVDTHIRRGFQRYYLGSKLAPERKSLMLGRIKALNPNLTQNWAECGSWVEEHFELWNEPIEAGFYDFYSLDVLREVPGNVARRLVEMEQESHHGATVENMVIEKIDTERELMKMRKLTEAQIA